MTRRSRGPRDHRNVRFLVGLAGSILAIFTTAALAGGFEKDDSQVGTSQNSVARGVPGRLETVLQAREQSIWRAAVKLGTRETSETGAAMPRRFLSELPFDSPRIRRIIALPDCAAVRIESVTVTTATGSLSMPASRVPSAAAVESVARIRDQAVAIVALDPAAVEAACGPVPPGATVDIGLVFEGARGPISRDTGPFTHACEGAILNYTPSAAPAWRPAAARGREGRGAVSYCTDAGECVAAGTDLLIVAAASLANAPALNALARHHASYLGLNVSVFSVGNLPELTPAALRDFIREVYDAGSSRTFEDGHLGFVLLVGDAYADDNETVMIPAYNGYGGDEMASDHYYACLAGTDEFEDVMLGRLSVGNIADLTAVVDKAANYMPISPDTGWDSRVLLVGGLFYSAKAEYVALFDEYDSIIPDAYQVDRIYRHDFASDELCALEVVDGFNDGHLIVNFAGDGWISAWDGTMNTTHIALMDNGGQLPIVLSMACMTGWFDNTDYMDWNGSYDCLAEQLVNAPGRGAIACLAASRSSDGGIFRTITEDIYRAIFEERCIFIGEAIAVGKLLHVQSGGDVAYARHLNLLGDPSIIFAWDFPPAGAPDLVVRPHQTAWSPELPGAGGTLAAAISVVNQSPVPAYDVRVRVEGQTAGGLYSSDAMIPAIRAWSTGNAAISLPDLAAGHHVATVCVDPDGAISELDETNNCYGREFYVYPHSPGFPIEIGVGLHAPAIGRLTEQECIVVLDEDARVRAYAPEGSQSWSSPAAANPLDFIPEIAPALGDINGDGRNEVVATRRMGVAALDERGGILWTKYTKEPVGYPVLADVNADGTPDAVLATVGMFGNQSEIVVLNGSGREVWSYALPTGAKPSACPAVGDLDLDGHADVVYGTNQGRVGAITAVTGSPAHLWGPAQIAIEQVAAIALGDLDCDGTLEVLIASNKLYCVDGCSGALEWSVPLGADVVCLSLADLDSDGSPEVIAGTKAGVLAMVDAGIQRWTATLSGTPGSSAAVADVDGDGELDILVGTAAGAVHFLSPEGEERGSAVPIPSQPSSPFAADTNGDGCPEVAICANDGTLFLLRFSVGAAGTVEWSGLGGNAAHTGLYAQPLPATITGTVTLSGTYTAAGDVFIAPGASLTLLPGTEIVFQGAASPRLEVQGALAAAGAPGAEVVLRGGGPSPWDGVVLSPGSTASLSSSRIEHASVGLSGSLATLALDAMVADGNTFGAILDRCTLTALDCTFSQSDSVGVRLLGGGGSIRDCLFSQNGKAGLECRESASHAVSRCTFSGTLAGDGLGVYKLSTVVIDSCASTANSRHGLLVQNASPSVTHTSLSGNGQYGVLCRKTAHPSFTRCTIVANRVGVYTESGSSPNLGNDLMPDTGYNRIMQNPLGAVTNASGAGVAVYARRNWWGSATPDFHLFSGQVLYQPWLTSPPGGGEVSSVPGGPETQACGLLAAVPNPFNPVTTLAYAVPEPGASLGIVIYDLSGRRVASLLDGFCEAGTHEVVWNGRDDRGERVASGVYFARMDSPESSSTIKLVLLK